MLARIAVKASCLLLLLIFSFTAKAQLHADFYANPTSQCAPAVVQFTDSSTGSPTQWKWDLGNGTTSFLKNPSAAYLNPGVYTVKLVIKNGAKSDSIIKSGYITVNALPAVQFTSTNTTGCYPLTVQFSDQSGAGSGSIVNWQWDFGDGFTSTLQNPSHIYNNSGSFNVTLRVTNSNGCTNTLSKTQYIKINAGVHADFTNSALTTCKPPININFQNTSSGTGSLSYQWNFGDGDTSSLQNPSHLYTASASYTVQLIATNSNGCFDTLTKKNAISIGSVAAAFSFNDSICLGGTTTFKNISTPASSSSLWDFGNGTTSTLQSPVVNYATSGTYNVKLVSNFGACIDSVYKNVTILPKPTAAFVADDSIECQAPITVNFTNQSANGTTYKWYFGDGATSTLKNPFHTYTTLGNYDVTMIVTNANGCLDSVKKKSYINIQPPKISFSNLPDSGCVPFTKTFLSTVTAADSVVSYLWDFGDGTTSTLAQPTHIFTLAGNYTIKLTVVTAKGCTTSGTAVNGIIASTIPVANFIADPLNTCAKTIVDFTDSSTGSVTHWLWNFGDGITSVVRNPTHIYNDTGYFDIQLIAYNRGCPDTLKVPKYVHINPPIAKFTITINCAKPYEKVFTDKSVGADEWDWDFGDGTTSSTPSPIHTYADTGTYSVTLLVKNYTSGCDFTVTQTVKVIVTKANFYASDTITCKGTPVIFTAPVGNPANIYNYYWNFGDGASVYTTADPITHTYYASGLYNVKFIVTNILGCADTLVKPQYIRVNGPTARFVSTVPGSCLNSAVLFSDSSVSDGTHPIQTWIWSYGDGVTDTLTVPPFQHLYTAAGLYPVSLKTVDNIGCTDTYQLPASLIISKPVAAFSSIDTLTCPGKTVSFINSSVGNNLTYLWDFGDSTADVTLNPGHSYLSDGAYTIKLLVSDKYGCTDSIAKHAYINIQSPMANFKMSDSVSTCPPLLVSFTNLSSSADSISWDFGDSTTSATNNPSHFYTYPGIYIVTLNVTGPGGCTNQIQKKISILGPIGTFAYTPLSGCVPVHVDFKATSQNASSFLWDFSDGTTADTTASAISHDYTHSGSYVPKMILSDLMGCHVAITGKDTIQVFGASAKFNFLNKALCDSGSISFKDSSTSNDSIASYYWNFGDNDTSISQSPSHEYGAPGLYYPKLTVTTELGCANTKTSTIPVRIVASPQVSIATTGNGCTPLNTIFNGVLSVPDTSAISWGWDFGNGATSSIQNPLQQTFSKAGIYTVFLKAVNSTGCFDTVSKSIEAYAIPAVNAGGNQTICEGHGSPLNATGADTYTWSPGTGLSCTNCASPIATPDSETKYLVVGTTVHGCSAKDSTDVKVKYPFVMKYSSADDTLCAGSSTKLSASGANSYIWTPEGSLNNSTIATPTASPDSTTTYQVIGTDEVGCFKDTGLVKIKVYPIPTVDAGPDKTINVGQTIDLIPTISKDVTTVTWSPTGAISRNAYPGITIQPNQTTQYTVEVTNAGGCTAHDDVTIYVVCDGANVFIPNTFSPNGDGANDIFYPRGTGLFKIKTFRVFNRWGQEVFENQNFMPNDAGSGWNGTFKGAKLTPDVYVYTIDIICNNNSVLTFSGNVALVQ